MRQKQYMKKLLSFVNGAPIPPDPPNSSGISTNSTIWTTSSASSRTTFCTDRSRCKIIMLLKLLCNSKKLAQLVPAGRLAKRENPNGYKNVLLHMKAHTAVFHQQQQAQQLHADQLALAGVKDKQKSQDGISHKVQQKKPPEKSGKINGAANANTPVQ